jgi:nicotinamide phosphoribosyltransferase
MSSYIEARGVSAKPEVLFFGLQMFLQRYFSTPVTQEDIEQAEPIVTGHGLPFNRDGWQHIVDNHAGMLPLEIEALPEGQLVKRGVPLVQVTNTDPACFWLTSYVETALLRSVWYPTTVASVSHGVKAIIRPILERTCDSPDEVLPFRLHDFGARGATSFEQAGTGGAAHLVSFQGTDTLSGVLFARQYYDCEMAGFSIPASEHSTMTAWGADHEADAYANMVDRFAANGLFAVVSDSYDIDHAVNEIWGKELREKVRASGATLVVRPDSGDPVNTPVRVIENLGRAFGTTINSKGFKVLADCVRVIQGDGITPVDIEAILNLLEEMGWSAENIAFGMGAGLLQKVDRDTYNFAMKANARLDSENIWRDVYKSPAAMRGKSSKAGRQAVVSVNGELIARRLDALDGENHLQPVWRNGKLLKTWTFDEVRARADNA